MGLANTCPGVCGFHVHTLLHQPSNQSPILMEARLQLRLRNKTALLYSTDRKSQSAAEWAPVREEEKGRREREGDVALERPRP
jgi:hypothetical protein